MTHASRYRIAEVARLTGFAPTTLRFYEGAGVVPRPARTAAGYRAYDDRDVERLRLIVRAKALGCTLDEIAGLVEAWDADECEPVKHRLMALVHTKVGEVEAQIAESVAFAAQLRRTAASVAAQPAVEGPCDDGCGCAGAVVDAPVACSLSGDAVAVRVDAWHAVLADVVARQPIAGGLRLTLATAAPVGKVASLAADEQRCCPFFTFALTIDDRGIALEVTAPADGQPVLDALFG